MDNRIISIQSEGQAAFNKAIDLLIDGAAGGKMSHYAIVEPGKEYFFNGGSDTKVKGSQANTLVLFWSEPSNSTWKLQASLQEMRMRPDGIKHFGWEWLVNQTKRDLHLKDTDVSLGSQGFLAFCEDWGHVANDPYAFAAIRPIYSWYGK